MDGPYLDTSLEHAGDVYGAGMQEPGNIMYGVALGRGYTEEMLQHAGDVYGHGPAWDVTPYYTPPSTLDVYGHAGDVYGTGMPSMITPPMMALEGSLAGGAPAGEGWSLRGFVWDGKRKYITIALVLVILYMVMKK